MRTPAVLAGLILAVAVGCDVPAASTSSAPSTALVARPVSQRVTLPTHCDVSFAVVDGLYWVAEPPRAAPRYLPGPNGIVRMTGVVSGIWTRIAPDRAEFVVDDEHVAPDPVPVRFRVAPEPAGRCA